MKENWDVVVIGAGAAGLMCAGTAAELGRSVLVLEHNKQIGRKILISGGGRCNFTNLDVSFKDFYSENEHFAKSALAQFSSSDFISLVENAGIKFHEKKLGQLFCNEGAKEILSLLEERCEKAGVNILTGVKVDSVEKNGKYILNCNDRIIQCESLVIATGGLSFPKIGATDFGHRLAKQFGLKVIHPHPALVGLTLNKNFPELAGVSMPVEISVGEKSITDDLLFTHKGLSGPATLKASLFWESGSELIVNFVPDFDLRGELGRRVGKKNLSGMLKTKLPNNFVDIWMNSHGISDVDMGNLSNAKIDSVCAAFESWKVIPSGTEGFRRAEVTRGGVCTSELSSKTMEAKKSPGLFFIGEVVDVTGQLGGYNFQWAWASGYVAGQSV